MADEHECDLCSQSFDTEEELHEHAQEEHEDEM
ncbi:C2H2-type zinc finger protein [Natrinema amylolyticum]